MALGLPRTDADEPAWMLDINTTPLIDVLLVLLVMLVITIPVQLHAVKMSLPGPAVTAPTVAAAPIAIDIDADGRILWRGGQVTAAQLDEHLAQLARAPEAPPVQIRTHRAAAYGVFIQVLAATRAHGLPRVAVVGVERAAP
jgi:biopolymer transport protein ExbD